MQVAGGRGVGGVEVAVGVDPEDAGTVLVRDAADRADGDRVVAAEDERHGAVGHRLPAGLVDALAGVDDRLQEGHSGLGRQGVPLDGLDVALVLDPVAKPGQGRLEARVAQCSGPQIDAAARLSQVERCAQDADRRLGGCGRGRHGVTVATSG